MFTAETDLSPLDDETTLAALAVSPWAVSLVPLEKEGHSVIPAPGTCRGTGGALHLGTKTVGVCGDHRYDRVCRTCC